MEDFLEESPLSSFVKPADENDTPMIGLKVGPYKLIRVLGRGGMGTAFLAERSDSEFDQRVAIKLINRGMDTDAAKELKELREQNARLKRLLAEAELVKDALREVAKDAPIDVKC